MKSLLLLLAMTFTCALSAQESLFSVKDLQKSSDQPTENYVGDESKYRLAKMVSAMVEAVEAKEQNNKLGLRRTEGTEGPAFNTQKYTQHQMKPGTLATADASVTPRNGAPD